MNGAERLVLVACIVALIVAFGVGPVVARYRSWRLRRALGSVLAQLGFVSEAVKSLNDAFRSLGEPRG